MRTMMPGVGTLCRPELTSLQARMLFAVEPFLRIFEVVRFRDARIKAYGAAAGVSVAVAKAYQQRRSSQEHCLGH